MCNENEKKFAANDERTRRKFHFTEKILNLEDGKQSHYNVMTKEIYDKLLAEVEDAKIAPKKSTLQYRRLKRFDIIIENDGNDRMKKLVSNSESKKLYLSVEEIYDAIEMIHVAVGHRGRDRLKLETSRKYANITIEMINIFLSMCEICQQKRNIRKKDDLLVNRYDQTERKRRCYQDDDRDTTTTTNSEDDDNKELKFDRINENHFIKIENNEDIINERGEEFISCKEDDIIPEKYLCKKKRKSLQS